ncbi:FprA family A-type flavoprotein [Pseudodesulfovibrio piezophilus]|uniref:Rubredoxin-oxygen oxidoreductase n=1 Tax=Pseudodesulfovibrio piezophilus (strain DSM 21447 / JCM 15486 / C1TLV30) TaxID=1322246 RepID=M1WW39_PSEP2|nr:flavodoxin domain-containing protein [Pseudodesulfovibrio piezophilus]CCH48898.1 Rubredoxin-oxygen oxidoreductase [Pseudodesulfovibrio piezophilus C1TLV30]
MKPVEIKEGVFWTGVVDWNRRNFHGYSIAHKGTTYNNFLIKDEKTVLIDTVAAEFWDTLKCNLAHALGPDGKIDYFVINHLEPDHAGCLEYAFEKYRPEKIYTSPMGEKAMKAHFHYTDWPVEVVPTGTEIALGKRTLQFVETRMLHWPDAMLTYCPEEKIAFTNDAFGQNWATSERWADEVNRSTLEELMGAYYANIVLPYSPVVLKTLKALGEMNLDIEMICPDHGLMFRGKEDIQWVFDKYTEFAEQKPKNKAVIVYDTMWHSTERMANAVASGLADEGVSVRVMSMKSNDHSDVMTEVFDAAAVVVGSPTHNNGILPLMADMLTYMKGLRPQNKIGSAIGSFGWSGECVKILNGWLEDMGMEVLDPVKVKHVPTHDTLAECYNQGKALAAAIKEKIG